MTENASTSISAHPFERTSVGEVMHRGVISCRPDATLRDAAGLMAEHRVHCLVVFAADGAEGRVWGVLTSLDLVAAARPGAGGATAGTVAASPVVSVDESLRLDRAAQLMGEYGVSHLVVVDPGSGRPVGVLSDLDLARTLALGGA